MKIFSKIVKGLCLFILLPLLGLQAQNDSGKSIPEIEKELAAMARDILNDFDTNKKIALNKEFINRMTEVLKRKESYDYPWDSLKTISILRPEDNSFRIFTWYVADQPKDSYYSVQSYYYFGLIQRKYETKLGLSEYIVIPLMEISNIPKGFESMVTDNYAWFGALYYKARFSDFIPSFDGYYYKLIPKKKQEIVQETEKVMVLTYTPGKYRSRSLKQINQVSLKTHDRIKEPVRYYMLTGWNGWDNKGNYKVFEIMSFDPFDSTKVVFGAPIIHFEKIPKARAMFKYSEIAGFTLNEAYVKEGLFNLFRDKMYVFDHLAPPQHANKTEMYEMGPDGTYDAIEFSKAYGGYFEVYSNIEPDFAYGYRQEKKHRASMAALQSGILMDSLQTSEMNYDKKAGKVSLNQFRKQRKLEEKRLKKKGMELKARKEEVAE